MNPEAWLRVTVAAPAGMSDGRVEEALVAAGGAAVLHEGDRLTTYLPLHDATSQPAALDAVRECLRGAGLAGEYGIEWDVEADRDWASEWKSGLRARRVGRRVVVRPPWDAGDLDPGDLGIVIEPGMAFGTGEHATTRGALRLLEDAVRPGTRVLDAGAGSGILAIAAALLGAERVLAVDADPIAVAAARANALANGVAHVVRSRVASVDARFLAEAPGYGVIAANILSGVLVPLLPAFRDALVPDGSLVVAGVLEEESSDFAAAAAATGLRCAAEDTDQGWWSARFARNDAPR